ncbi:flavin reductase family protein [Phanerochaete sordida]|uniref:Flavin reductase family protein n=1 Tax=Phanerochaete sordida TaxID=48140 RepID=A0A9P3GKC8_9APHY|nr:flavin reductase family protein [Phanerochaete sordida]
MLRKTARGSLRQALRTAPRSSACSASRRLQSSLPKYDPHRTFKLTQPPTPSWDLGEGVSTTSPLAEAWNAQEKEGWKHCRLEDMPRRDVYKMLTSAVIPRPIAFVSSLSPDGQRNLAPMSYFNVIAHNPPLLTVSFSFSPGVQKDSRENILNTKEFTVSIISDTFVEAANVTSVTAPPDVDEWVVSGLTPEPSTTVKPPRVKESAVGLECTLYRHLDITAPDTGELTHTLVLGLIMDVHVRNAVLAADGQSVDPAKLRPVARLGGAAYATLGDGFELGRPSWRKLGERVLRMLGRSA